MKSMPLDIVQIPDDKLLTRAEARVITDADQKRRPAVERESSSVDSERGGAGTFGIDDSTADKARGQNGCSADDAAKAVRRRAREHPPILIRLAAAFLSRERRERRKKKREIILGLPFPFEGPLIIAR
jgi:hypothetical protein